MAELKTQPSESSVAAFLKGVADAVTRRDCKALIAMMKEASGARPKMWGTSIVGFGNCHYKYASGREGDWFLVGFSPRKQGLTIYLACGVAQNQRLLKKLGKHKAGVGCLYIKRLADVNSDVLRELVWESVVKARKLYGESK
jgi:hypothetical protein